MTDRATQIIREQWQIGVWESEGDFPDPGEFDAWLAEHDRQVAEKTRADLHAHIDSALTGSRSPVEETWPGYWEAKQHALDELTAVRTPSSSSKGEDRG